MYRDVRSGTVINDKSHTKYKLYYTMIYFVHIFFAHVCIKTTIVGNLFDNNDL